MTISGFLSELYDVNESTAKSKLAYLARKRLHRYLKRKPDAIKFLTPSVKPDDGGSITESLAGSILSMFK